MATPKIRPATTIAADLWTKITEVEALIEELPEAAPTHNSDLRTQKAIAQAGMQGIRALASVAASG